MDKPIKKSRFFIKKLYEKNKSLNLGNKKAYHVNRQLLKEDLSALKESKNKLNSIIPMLPDNKGLSERVYFLSAGVDKLQRQLDEIDNLNPMEKRELRDNLLTLNREFSRLLKIAEEAAKEKKVIALYAADPWAPFGGMDEIIEQRTPPAEITVEAFQGEVESASLNVFNFSGSPRTLRVDIEKINGPQNAATVSKDDVFTLRETVDVPTQDADLSADALPELNSGNLLLLPAWYGRQLWITINTDSLTPGLWTVVLSLKSLDVEPLEARAELKLKIWDAALPKKNVLNLCVWSGTERPKGTFGDQVAHGVNVFTSSVPPKAEFDEKGKIISVDYTAHDRFMKQHSPYGTILFHSLVSLHGPSPAFSPAWLKAYRAFIPMWINHLKENGYGYENFAFYPVDEPGLEHGKNVKRFMKWAKLVRAIDPKIRIYANPVAEITMEQLEEMKPYVDIWTPMKTNIYPKDKLAFIHSTKTAWWNYDPSDDAKHLSPLGNYRGQSWMIWHYGHSGIGFYTYYQGPNYWFRPEQGFDYAMIYEGKGVVTSKRWEAVRDGVEDFALLNALKEAADAADKKGLHKELVKKTRRVLNEKAALIADFMNDTNPGKKGQSEARKIADKRWEIIKQARRELAALLTQWQGE